MVAHSDNWTTDRTFNSSVVKSRVFAFASIRVARSLSVTLLLPAGRLSIGEGSFCPFVSVGLRRSFVTAKHSLEMKNPGLAQNRHPMARVWSANWRGQAQG